MKAILPRVRPSGPTERLVCESAQKHFGTDGRLVRMATCYTCELFIVIAHRRAACIRRVARPAFLVEVKLTQVTLSHSN
jgi:hypothetical protein